MGDAAAQPTLPTGTDFSLGVSFSFCGGSVRKETSVGCAQLNRSEGSDWRALWVLPLRPTQSGYWGDASLSRLRLYYFLKRVSTLPLPTDSDNSFQKTLARFLLGFRF